MFHYREMLDKYGFNDGSDEPDNSLTARALYVTTLNMLAERLKSGFRVVAWDRPGMHNRCMIVYVTLDEFNELGGDPTASNPEVAGVSFDKNIDEEFETAEDMAFDMNLDDLITKRGDMRKNAIATIAAKVNDAVSNP